VEQVPFESPMTSFSTRTVSGGVLVAERKSRFGMSLSRRRNFQLFPSVPVEGRESSGKEDVLEECDGEEMPIEGDEDGEDGEVAQYQDDGVTVSEELAAVAVAVAVAELRTTALVGDR